MPVPAPIDVVNTLYAAFARQDGPAIMALLDPETIWTLYAPPPHPYGGTFHGVAGVATFLGAIGASVDVLALASDEFVAQGNVVTVVGHETIRAKATGKTLTHRWVQLFEVRNGKIVRFEEFYDSASALGIFVL